MLNVGALQEGFVLDHIKAGKAMSIYHDLGLDKIEDCVAIIKIEAPIESINLDTLGFIDHNITVNIIQNGQIVGKKNLTHPKKIKNIVKCKNPRCITTIEQELDQIFILTDEEHAVYRCLYCEEKYN